MTYIQFLSILNNYQQYNETISEAYGVGLDLLEGKFSTGSYVEKIVEQTFLSHYTEEGLDWIMWFIYENKYGQNGMEAYDEEKNLICQSYQSLYDYLEKNHKNVK